MTECNGVIKLGVGIGHDGVGMQHDWVGYERCDPWKPKHHIVFVINFNHYRARIINGCRIQLGVDLCIR